MRSGSADLPSLLQPGLIRAVSRRGATQRRLVRKLRTGRVRYFRARSHRLGIVGLRADGSGL